MSRNFLKWLIFVRRPEYLDNQYALSLSIEFFEGLINAHNISYECGRWIG